MSPKPGRPTWRASRPPLTIAPDHLCHRRQDLEGGMTESEWLSGREPHVMLAAVEGRAEERQLQRFSAACCRRIWPYLTDERSRRAVVVAELDADGRVGPEERLAAARGGADALADIYRIRATRPRGLQNHATWAAALCLFAPEVTTPAELSRHEVSRPFDCAQLVASHSAYAMAIASVRAILPESEWHARKAEMHARLEEETKAEHAEQCHLL